jgi:ankyrin repeat protein
MTALHLAAGEGYEGHEEVVALLLENGAHTNRKDDHGRTPLMRACVIGHLGVVKMLVQHMGVQGLDKEDEDAWTTLHYAAAWGHPEVVKWLLLAGADATIRDNEGLTPRAVAELRHDRDISDEGDARCVALFQVRPMTC